MAATNYTPIQIYHSTTTTAVPVNTNLVDGELAINITDGKLFYKDNSGTVQVIATKATGTIGGSTTQVQYNNAGVLAGSANFTFNGTTATINTLNLTNALGAAYGGTAQSSYTAGDIIYATGATALAKLGIGLVNYILTSTGSAPQWSAPTAISVSTATNLAGGAAGSVPYQSGAGATTFLAIGTANRVLTSSGTAPQWSTALTGLTSVSSNFDTLGGSGFTLPAVLSATAPAKLYINTSTVTDGSSAIGATNALGAITSFDATTVAATNANVTYTNLATLVINAVPVAGTNVTITNPYALYVAAGASYFGSTVTVNGTVNATTLDLTNLEVTNIKAKDGTAAIVLTDSTGAVTISTALTANGGAVFNENGANVDFRVEGDTDANLIFADASADFVGIGTASPAAKFQTQQTSAGSRVTGALLQNVGSTASTAVSLDFAPHENTTTPEVLARINAIRTNQNNAPTDLVFSVFNVTLQERARITSTGTLNIVGAGTAGSTQAISFNGSTPVDTLVTTTTGVGIGTNAPAFKLDIKGGNGTQTRFDNAGEQYTQVYWANNGTSKGAIWADNTNSLFEIYGYSGVGLGFWTNGTKKMWLDTSGNLGLGVTPSAWGGAKAFEAGLVGNYFIGSTAASYTSIGTASYYNGSNWLYARNTAASKYELLNDTHAWFNAPSGTAGATTSITSGLAYSVTTLGSTTLGEWQAFFSALTGIPSIGQTVTATATGTLAGGATVTQIAVFTQAMTLDASGNLGVGTTSIASGGAGTINVNFHTPTSTSVYLKLSNAGTGNSASDGFDLIAGSSGDAYVYNRENAPIIFGTDNTERARITSGGYFKASSTGAYLGSTGGYHELRANTDNNNAAIISHNGTNGTQYGLSVRTTDDQNDATRNFLECLGGATLRAAIYTNGGLSNYSANNVNLASDERLKKDISPLGSTWGKVKAIEVVNFRYKDCNEGDPALFGVIAQQVQPIVPDLVVVTKNAQEAIEAKDAVLDADGNVVEPAVAAKEATPEYYGIREQPMYWLAIKALQEAMARIETLEAEVAALKGA